MIIPNALYHHFWSNDHSAQFYMCAPALLTFLRYTCTHPYKHKD